MWPSGLARAFLDGWLAHPEGKKLGKFEEKWEKMVEIWGKIRKMELLPTRDCEAGYAPDVSSFLDQSLSPPCNSSPKIRKEKRGENYIHFDNISVLKKKKKKIHASNTKRGSNFVLVGVLASMIFFFINPPWPSHLATANSPPPGKSSGNIPCSGTVYSYLCSSWNIKVKISLSMMIIHN